VRAFAVSVKWDCPLIIALGARSHNTKGENIIVRPVRLAFLVLCVLSVVRCSSTLKPATLDPAGRFPTESRISPGGVKIARPFDSKFKPLLYVKIDDSKANMYRDFFVSSFRNMNFFTVVNEKSDFEKMIIERKLTDKVSNVSDLIGLNNLAKQVGPFLVVEPHLEWQGGYNYIASLKAIDPETGETVLHLEQKAFNWAGLDKPLFYPLLNAFIDWANGRTIATASPPAAS
jgi:hypothetical protein